MTVGDGVTDGAEPGVVLLEEEALDDVLHVSGGDGEERTSRRSGVASHVRGTVLSTDGAGDREDGAGRRNPDGAGVGVID